MLLGGLALFLYGMKIMGEGLELAAGDKLQSILEKLTSNKLLGMLVGLVVTAIIQSSSATTVMVVGFVNAGLMNLTQAVSIIMGANIGTTITGQLIALDINAIAPVIAFLGLVLIMFTKKSRTTYLGQVLMGLGILFMGMNIMSDSMIPLQKNEAFCQLMTNFNNPFLGILIGTGVTCIIQSSSASVGILQALASQNLIGIGSAVYVIYGQNIGTCITSLLASIGSNKNAKRTALCHVLFNIVGTILFIFITFFLPFQEWIITLSPGNTVKQIANVHTIFNIVTTIFLFPFTTQLAKCATKLIPGEDAKENEMELQYLSNCNFHDSTVAMACLDSEIKRMNDLTLENFKATMTDFSNHSINQYDKISSRENLIDFLNVEIAKCAVKATSLPLSNESSFVLNRYIILISNLERIADHSQNIADHGKHCFDSHFFLSQPAMDELLQIRDLIIDMFSLMGPNNIDSISSMENQVDELRDIYRLNHIERMKKGNCSPEIGIIYDEILTDLERIADHLMNMAESHISI